MTEIFVLILFEAMKELIYPVCGSPMSVFTFAKAPTPWHLKCENCNAKLKLRKSSALGVILASIIGSAIGLVHVALQLSIIYLLLMLILGVIIFESLAFYICKLLEIDLVSR
jgi:hypothetical protein